MLRTRAARKQPSDHNGPGLSHGLPLQGLNQVDDDSRGRSKAFLPRSTLMALTLFLIGTIGVIYSRLSTKLRRHEALNPSERSKMKSSSNSQPKKSYDKSSDNSNSTPNHNTNKKNAVNDVQNTYSPTTNRTLHVIFSTDCSTFQHWQSYLFFHSAYKISQPGYITRIASGCKPEEEEKERKWHEENVQHDMSERYRIHFTPHFSGVKDATTGEVKGDYKFFNKPFGLKHFLEFGEFTGLRDGVSAGDIEGSGFKMKDPQAIIILCDPDFLLLRPLTDDFSNERETIISIRRKTFFQSKHHNYPQLHDDLPSRYIVDHGRPFGQTYGLGAQWRKFGLEVITGVNNSPAKAVDQSDGGLLYPAGPPYIGTAEDMYKIAVKWSEFVPGVHHEYPHLLAEMYAYCIAAAHLELPHTLVDSMMISSSGVGGEGWKFIQNIPSEEVCPFAMDFDHSKYPLPSVIHFCQHYQVDKFFFSKRKMPHDIFTCDFPLLVEPPMDIGSGKYLSFIAPNRPATERKSISPEKEKMEAFVVCALTKAVNDASIHFKTRHCSEGGWNDKKTYNLWSGKKS
mmetsp:Transcript_29883/g.59750  ORF Transcript_29883/g.59750 Transcript_29883/m.59750 type:complete len:567 (+) Transcript_29883:152-1852(+)